MVSLRCKLIVKEELDKMGLSAVSVELGVIELFEDISSEVRKRMKRNLLRYGFYLMEDEESIIIDKLKYLIAEMIHYADSVILTNYPDYISDKLGQSYQYLSDVFEEVRGCTIENYITGHKIEKIKELMLYDELSLNEIAKILNYKSALHLSIEFKRITGLLPAYFKKLKKSKSKITPKR